MKMLKLTSLFILSSVGIAPALARKAPALTPMELQALQTKEFKTSKENVFASVVSVFQDLGYQVTNADAGSGFITAESANTNKTNIFEAFGGARSSGHTRATAFVESMPNGFTRARLNFMSTKESSSMYGAHSAQDRAILDPRTYQVAFDKIDEALFERGAIAKTDSAAVAPTVEVPLTPRTTIVAPDAAKAPPVPSAVAPKP